MEPHRSPPSIEPDTRRGKEGFFDGYESQTVRTYTVRDGCGTKQVTERTVTRPNGQTVTYREETSECSTLPGTFNNLRLDSGFGNMGKLSPRLQDQRRVFTSESKDSGRKSPRVQTSFLAGKTSPTPVAPSASKKTSQPSSGAGGTSLKEFREQALTAHNERRKRHGVPPLKLSSDLNDYAQKWADHLVKSNTFQHSDCTMGGDRLGENIANKWSSAGADYTGEEVTEQWYSEIKKHDYTSERSMGTGHFTQVVWKDSQELGMGKAKSSDGKVIVVGSYRPAGNFIGNFTKNVFPPK